MSFCTLNYAVTFAAQITILAIGGGASLGRCPQDPGKPGLL